MLKKVFAASLALGFALSASTADAALNAYLKIKGSKTNVVGSVIQKGREGSTLVTATTHEIVSPRDPASGLPTGKRMHKPFTVTAEVDKATPLLYKMMTQNENLTEVELRFWRASPTGAEQQFYTVKLTNASISNIRYVQPSTTQAETRTQQEYVEVAFTYQKIEWTWTDGGVTAVDDWTAR
jgi:type VI secretion system secreted protein Hcp